eukprot:6739417-Karenia_brevis.AAC.1
MDFWCGMLNVGHGFADNHPMFVAPLHEMIPARGPQTMFFMQSWVCSRKVDSMGTSGSREPPVPHCCSVLFASLFIL